MSHDELLAQAKRHMERWGPAKSCINEAEAFFELHGPKLGPIEHAGAWAGPRREYREVYDIEILRGVLVELGIAKECPLMDALFGSDDGDAPEAILGPSQLKAIAQHPAFKKRVIDALNAKDEDDNPIYEDGGLIRMAGNWNFTPIGKKPNEDKYDLNYGDDNDNQ